MQINRVPIQSAKKNNDGCNKNGITTEIFIVDWTAKVLFGETLPPALNIKKAQ